MSKEVESGNVEMVERRIHWRDRRVSGDRRHPARLQLSKFDCRSGLPRRSSDVGGKLADGDVWWNKPVVPYE